jgi:hypothetical protein
MRLVKQWLWVERLYIPWLLVVIATDWLGMREAFHLRVSQVVGLA